MENDDPMTIWESSPCLDPAKRSTARATKRSRPGVWEPFLASVQGQLIEFDTHIQKLCGRSTGASDAAQDGSTAGTATFPLPAIALSLPVRYGPESERERVTNYNTFRPRGNASRRIFKPHRLEYPPYRNRRKIVPILLGNPCE
jgi:hypothetical protein